MANFEFLQSLTLVFLILGARNLLAAPLDTDKDSLDATTSNAVITEQVTSNNNHSLSPGNQPVLDLANSEPKELTSATIPSNAAKTGNDNPDSSPVTTSLYANFFTPEAIQQYINQFGSAYPGYPAYPAPIGYGAAAQSPASGVGPIYPGPYVVQTGYEGYLVPTATTGLEAASGIQNSNNPFTYLANFFSALMMSAVFRVITTILGAIAMIFFGGALSRFLCSVTPLCQVTNTAVEYFKNDGNAKRVVRMITEGMTPERVRRTTEFVQEAIRKYQQLQKLVGNAEKDD